MMKLWLALSIGSTIVCGSFLGLCVLFAWWWGNPDTVWELLAATAITMFVLTGEILVIVYLVDESGWLD